MLTGLELHLKPQSSKVNSCQQFCAVNLKWLEMWKFFLQKTTHLINTKFSPKKIHTLANISRELKVSKNVKICYFPLHQYVYNKLPCTAFKWKFSLYKAHTIQYLATFLLNSPSLPVSDCSNVCVHFLLVSPSWG